MQLDLTDEIFKDPELIVQYLEHFGFAQFKIHKDYISFGRSEDGSPTSIVCYFNRNKAYVEDYPLGISGDIIGFIQQEKSLNFREASQPLKKMVEGVYSETKYKVRHPFGGFFKGNTYEHELNDAIDEAILESYEPIGNQRFKEDGISYKAQRFFEVGYLPGPELITIPLRDDAGKLVGVKARKNFEVGTSSKYLHLEECSQALMLYGYSQNYDYINNSKEIYIFEAEKSVMQAYSFGIRNCVALGGSAISDKQVELLFRLNPKRIILMLDEGLMDFKIEDSMEKLQSMNESRYRFLKLKPVELAYWQPSELAEPKDSPTDHGKERFEQILNEEIKIYGKGV